jgi:ribonuclease G
MPQEILVNVTPREVRVALLEAGSLQEIYIERSVYQGLLGNIYKGRVSRLLPGIQAAFIDIGLDRSAFLHISDMGLATHASDEKLHSLDIRDYLKSGQDILVQVYKNPLGTKGARLTTQFTIPSRFLVLTPGTPQVALSQKITDEAERERLTALISPDQSNGYIFRTVAEGVSEADILTDQLFLQTLWREVQEKIKITKAPKSVYEEIPITLKVLRDLAGFDVAKIRVDNQTVLAEMMHYTDQYVPALSKHLEFHDKNTPIFDLHEVESDIQKALEPRIALKSGGHIVFDQTEAMTTIDINTGSYLGVNSLEQTVFKTNLESVDVIAKQIRLRNLGGIIIIDFIDMIDVMHKEHLLEALKKAIASDPGKVQMSELSSLGLVQITRKRTRESLEHILCKVCPTCSGRGSIKSIKTICYDIFRELQRVSQYFSGTGISVIASPQVIEEIETNEQAMLNGIEINSKKIIKLRAELNYAQDRYDIFPLSEKE